MCPICTIMFQPCSPEITDHCHSQNPLHTPKKKHKRCKLAVLLGLYMKSIPLQSFWAIYLYIAPCMKDLDECACCVSSLFWTSFSSIVDCEKSKEDLNVFGTFVIISTKFVNWSEMKRLAFFSYFVRNMHADEVGGGTSCPLNGFLVIWWAYLMGTLSSLTKKLHNPHTWQHLKNETQIPIMWDNLQGRPLLYQPWTWMVRKS